jgi:hypothetical protein
MVVAGLTAPLVGMMVVTLGLRALSDKPMVSWNAESDTLAHMLFFIIFFGWPGAYLLEACVGIPAYFMLKSRGLLRPWAVIGIAALTGAVAFAIPRTAVSGAWNLHSLETSLLLGALGGAAAGWWFWLVAFRRRSHPASAVPLVPERRH